MDSTSVDTCIPPLYKPIVDFHETFQESTLSSTRWVSHYLPKWTTPDRSRASYTIRPGMLTLEIRAEQLSWLPSDGHLRVSNIQTASFSGPVGSDRGTHRHRPDLHVQTAQPLLRLYTPSAPARVEATLRAHPHNNCMLAFWLVGLENDCPQDSGEICVAEIFGDKAGNADEPDGRGRVTEINAGIKKHGDPKLTDDMLKVVLPGFNACEWHKYAAEWDESEVRILIDGEVVKTSPQTIRYPMQIMIDLFEFPKDEESRSGQNYPMQGDIKEVTGSKLIPL